MQADGLHPNELGQPLLLENVWPKLEPLLRRPHGAGTRPPARRASDTRQNGWLHMDRFWLPQYPPGVPADIDPFEIDSLKSLIEDACERYADRDRLSQHGHRDQLSRARARSRAFGAWLQQRAGLKSGDRIAIMLPNLLQYPIAMFGALRAGLTVVNTNPLYTATELEHQLQGFGRRGGRGAGELRRNARAGAARHRACAT